LKKCEPIVKKLESAENGELKENIIKNESRIKQNKSKFDGKVTLT